MLRMDVASYGCWRVLAWSGLIAAVFLLASCSKLSRPSALLEPWRPYRRRSNSPRPQRRSWTAMKCARATQVFWPTYTSSLVRPRPIAR